MNSLYLRRLPVLIFLTFVTAETLAVQSVYEKALIENSKIESPKKSLATPSDAQTQVPDGMLTLKDDFQTRTPRAFRWNFGLSTQRFQPQGPSTNPLGGNNNLSEAGGVWFPVLALGASTNSADGVFAEASLRAGYATQRLKANTASVPLDTTLVTTLLAVQPQLGWQSGPWIAAILAEYGQISYAQTSTSSKASLNRNFKEAGFGLSAKYLLTPRVRGFVSWIDRSALGAAENQLQKTNIELGTTFIW